MLTSPPTYYTQARSCACYCPRSGYAFDWLANAVQQQATTNSRLEDKVDRLAVLLETAFASGGLPAESTSDGHYMTPNDASEAGETAASSDPSSSPEPESITSDADKSTVQPGSSQETVSFAAAGGGADSLPLRLGKFLKFATSSAANGLVGAHYPSGSSSPPSPSDDYDRLSTTSHDDDNDSSTCESDDNDFGDESERDEDQANGTTFEAKAAAVWPGRAGGRVGSWLESVE